MAVFRWSHNMKSFFVAILFLTSVSEIVDCLPLGRDSEPSRRERSFRYLVKKFDGKRHEECTTADGFQCPREDVTFWLTTRGDMHNQIQLQPLNPVGRFVVGAPLKVLIDGYDTDRDRGFLYNTLRLAYLNRGEYNIIIVDWGPLCKRNCYASAADSVPTVGHCVAQFLRKLLEVNRGVFSEVHVLGTSLGAHISARASLQITTLDRITMFDPALPMFSNRDTLFRKGRATIVDVWHSNTRIFGRPTPDGTVDIYLNNGRDQPGCNCDIDCSHGRGMAVFAETISSFKPLLGFLCAGRWIDYRKRRCQVTVEAELGRFGEDFSPVRTGVHLAFTNAKTPYIISSRKYLNTDTFYSFKKTHDPRCYRHRTIAFFAKHFR